MINPLHSQWCLDVDERKKCAWGFSELENQKNKMFYWQLFKDAEAKGGHIVKEADFEAEKKVSNTKKISFPTLL